MDPVPGSAVPSSNATSEYEAEVYKLFKSVELNILRALPWLATLRIMNEIDEEIARTEPGALVAGTQMTKEQFQAVLEMLDSFSTWVKTDLPNSKVSPLYILTRRSWKNNS